jgi:hypothetical protein
MNRIRACDRSLSLPTPRTTLAAAGALWGVCRRCNHASVLNLGALDAGPHADRPLRELPLRCASCGTDAVDTVVGGGWRE